MDWRTRTSALPIRDLRQIVYLLPVWGGIWRGVVFLWRRLICPQNSSLRMFWYRDLNSSHFFPRFGLLEHKANRTPDISATFIGSCKKFCKRKRMSVCPARKTKAKCFASVLWVESFQSVQERKNYAPSNFVPLYGPHVVNWWFLHANNALSKQAFWTVPKPPVISLSLNHIERTSFLAIMELRTWELEPNRPPWTSSVGGGGGSVLIDWKIFSDWICLLSSLKWYSTHKRVSSGSGTRRKLPALSKSLHCKVFLSMTSYSASTGTRLNVKGI